MVVSNKKTDSKFVCDFSHHAYCLVGERQTILDELHNQLSERLNFSVVGNPDYWLGEYDKLNMKDGEKEVVRDEILSQALLRPVGGKNRVMIICANSINENVQNSLLKFFEEPVEGLKIFLILPSASRLLSTIKSRLLILEIGEAVLNEKDFLDADKFLAGGIAKRLEMSATIIKALSDEDIVKNDIISFLHQVQKKWADKLNKKKMTAEDAYIFKEIEKCCSYVGDQSPSIKVLLEYLAIVLPKNVINK
jgi:DNA polymerase III delta prime subunit